MLDEESGYYELLNKQEYLAVFKHLRNEGSSDNLPLMESLIDKLRDEKKAKAVALGEQAVMYIKRREQARKDDRQPADIVIEAEAAETVSLQDGKYPRDRLPYFEVFAVLAMTLIAVGAFLLIKRR